MEDGMNNNGWKLFNDEDSFFSWHETKEDAAFRARFESRVYGREFRIAKLTDAEAVHYGNLYAARLQ